MPKLPTSEFNGSCHGRIFQQNLVVVARARVAWQMRCDPDAKPSFISIYVDVSRLAAIRPLDDERKSSIFRLFLCQPQEPIERAKPIRCRQALPRNQHEIIGRARQRGLSQSTPPIIELTPRSVALPLPTQRKIAVAMPGTSGKRHARQG